ncbi:hypothetical protein D1F64_20445 [Breoghania sp. L-A4]|nr:hypothetical protein D1F64_20445 [Breoghania sp. L-A4]
MKFIGAAVVTAFLCAAPVAAHAEDLVFTITNGTNSVLTEFYTSPKGTKDWEEDVFGNEVLEPGESIEITIADGREVCVYDMRFEFAEGSDLETTEDTQDLCALGSYTIHE